MSAKTTVEVSEDADGRVRAVDTSSGTTGEGDTIPVTLENVTDRLDEDIMATVEDASGDDGASLAGRDVLDRLDVEMPTTVGADYTTTTAEHGPGPSMPSGRRASVHMPWRTIVC